MKRDEIDELLEDWWWWQQEYEPVRGHQAPPAFENYRSGWRDSADLADDADDRARAEKAEAVDACVSQIDLPARVAIQLEMRNRFAPGRVWSSVRVDDLPAQYARAKALLHPLLVARGMIDRACKPDKVVL